MQDRHTCEGVDAKRHIKKGLILELYLYEIPEPGKRFEYVVVENDSSDKIRDKMEYPEIVRRLGKKIDISYYLKTVVDLYGNKAGDNKADDSGVDVDNLDKDEEDEDKIDKDVISKIRDILAQKLAEKWKKASIYMKKLFDTTYADKGEYLTNNAYYQSFLNALDKQEESIRLKLSSLLKEFPKLI
ncbi:hypothetical protein RclHR1_01960015 [Rhizophagus clarus]|uniref:DNA-directed DNA polymerase n=1 Tax=Rhizophagus clarus TaxID=94130 RepID=A0A2Z6QRG9_9GLOM|nr:hypothetical protein RclHR1_01960015 [Rhizophagus clarus]GES78535.1 hypothetical protein GLOIN_2v1783037 [Rhizophagus clarus]